MELTRSFAELVRKRAGADPQFDAALRREGIPEIAGLEQTSDAVDTPAQCSSCAEP
jgi:hypothetical protein